jgi:hypothetical protein
MNLIDRYIYAVTSRLTAKQQSDIEKELRTLIDDMLEQYPEEEPMESKITKVLLELGDPAILADSYRETKRYLIGPQNFDNYQLILKIVMGAVFLGISIASALGSFFSSQLDVASMISEYISILFSALMQGFAWVTVIFAIAEYKGIKLMSGMEKEGNWNLSDLPVVPEKEAAISRVDSIFSILFLTISTSIFYFAPQLIAVYFKNGTAGFNLIPIFNISVLNSYKLFIIAIFILGIVKEVPKIVSGRWTLKLSIFVTILSLASMILSLIVISNPDIWNINFVSDILRYLGADVVPGEQWMNIAKGSILIIVVGTIAEIATTMYKGIKFNTTK